MFDLLLPTISQGLLWSLLALGVYITFRVLDIADLTVEGSFLAGASVAVTLLVKDVNPVTAILAAALAGGVAGVVTGLLHTKLRIPALLAGILTMIALYSVNMRIMGKANISLLGKETAFTLVESALWGGLFPGRSPRGADFLRPVLRPDVLVLRDGNRGSHPGYWLQSPDDPGPGSGYQHHAAHRPFLQQCPGGCGWIFGSPGAMDLRTWAWGVGTIVIGLASVIIGEVLFGTHSFKNSLISVILGSIVYRLVIAIVLQMGMPPNDLKLFTAVLVAIALSLPMVKGKFQSRKAGI